MTHGAVFHVVTVGWGHTLIPGLHDRIGAKSQHRFSHLAHPGYTPEEWPGGMPRPNIYFFRGDLKQPMPAPNRHLLESLEQDGIPTIHNMIRSDRIVSRLDYDEALAYATFLTQKLITFYRQIQPSVIIGTFDALHGSLSFAVAKQMNIPWFALQFSVLPKGLACFCNSMSPASTVTLGPRSDSELRSLAEQVLGDFEGNKIQAPAYITPNLVSPSQVFGRIPTQIKSLCRTMNRGRLGQFRKFTDYDRSYSIIAQLKEGIRNRKNLIQLPRRLLLDRPPAEPYVFFGLHMQPESSIDVWAHFYSDQVRVIDLISRSIPPTHKLLVKLHKSDVTNYSPKQLAQFRQFHGVQLVSPFVNTRTLIENAAVIFAIQGTIGLEAALLGKPVVMFGDSPVKNFPSAATVGKITDLPNLIRNRLLERPPCRAEIIDAFARYLAPFQRASMNNWTELPSDREIDGYVELFESLAQYVRMADASVASAGAGK